MEKKKKIAGLQRKEGLVCAGRGLLAWRCGLRAPELVEKWFLGVTRNSGAINNLCIRAAARVRMPPSRLVSSSSSVYCLSRIFFFLLVFLSAQPLEPRGARTFLSRREVLVFLPSLSRE